MGEISKLHQIDIARREAAENARTQTEETFRLLVDAVQDYAIFALDPTGRILTWNSGAERLKGYSSDEIIGAHFSIFYTSEDIARKHPEEELRIASIKGKYEEEGWRIRKDGTRFWANVLITALKDPGGSLRGFAKVTRDLTERKKAEDAMRVARERFERQARVFDTALSSSPDFHYIFDSSFRFTYANKSLLDLWELKFEQIIGKTPRDIPIPAELITTYETALREVLATGKTAHRENSYREPSGSIRHYEHVFVPVFDKQHNVHSISVTSRDVTTRKTLEENRLNEQRLDLLLKKAKEQEEQFRSLANSMPQLAWVADSEGNVVWYNQRWYEYTGTKPQETDGWKWQSVQHPDYLPKVLEQWKASISTGIPFEMEFPLRGADGNFRTFLTRVNPVKDLQGTIVRWFGTNTEIEEQFRTREVFQTLNEVSQSISAELDITKLMQAVTDAATKLSRAEFGAFFYNTASENGETHTLCTHSGAQIEALSDFLPPTSDSTAIVRSADITSDPRFRKNAPSNEMPSGPLRVVSYLSIPVVTRSGEVLGSLVFGHGKAGVFTEKEETLVKSLASQAAIALDNAKLVQKLQDAVRVRDEFLSIASHELKTPLTPLKLQIQNLSRFIATGRFAEISQERLQNITNTSDRQINRIAALVEDLLDVSRITAGKFSLNREEVNLVEVVEEALERYGTQIASAGSSVSISAPEKLIGNWDRLRIEQVFINLLTNAVKYAPGTPIEIALSLETATAILSVKDHGIGISEEDQNRVFDRFERVRSSNNVGGLGLGLFISRQIVEAHNGTISVSSALNQGSTFTIRLPLLSS